MFVKPNAMGKALTVESEVDDIQDVIPSDASTENKLATKSDMIKKHNVDMTGAVSYADALIKVANYFLAHPEAASHSCKMEWKAEGYDGFFELADYTVDNGVINVAFYHCGRTIIYNLHGQSGTPGSGHVGYYDLNHSVTSDGLYYVDEDSASIEGIEVNLYY